MSGVQVPRPGSVELWAARKPDAVIAIEGDVELRWGALNDRADRLAYGLAARGVKVGDIVAVRTQVRLEWIVINAALAKLGCVLLGVNWRLTPDELDYLLRNSGATALICDDRDPAALVSVLHACGICIALSIDVPAAGFDLLDDAMRTPASPLLSAADTPLIIYTSGTTGHPKGVVLGRLPGAPPPGREAIEYAASVAAANPKTENDTILVSMPLSHGSAPAQIRRQIQAGGRMVLTRRFVPEETLGLIARHGVTSWVVVPTMLNRLAALPEPILRAHDLSSLKSIQVGAAPVSPTIKHWVTAHFGDDVLHEGYGSTETGMVSNLTPEMHRLRPSSCGTPYAHVHISIRDSDGVALPAASTGEIWVSTPAVINGYFNGPPLAADVLDDAGYFRTGDIGHLDADGFLYITGRSKDMIVSGGVNIYPAEIEAALHGHPAVQTWPLSASRIPNSGNRSRRSSNSSPVCMQSPPM